VLKVLLIVDELVERKDVAITIGAEIARYLNVNILSMLNCFIFK